MKNQVCHILLLILALIFFIPTNSKLTAGQTGKIAGTISDAKTGEALIGVNVYLENKNIGAASDEKGYYVILNIPPGEYTLIASMIGYRSMKVTNIRVAVDRTTNYN